jgi:hypothetical protein
VGKTIEHIAASNISNTSFRDELGGTGLQVKLPSNNVTSEVAMVSPKSEGFSIGGHGSAISCDLTTIRYEVFQQLTL